MQPGWYLHVSWDTTEVSQVQSAKVSPASQGSCNVFVAAKVAAVWINNCAQAILLK